MKVSIHELTSQLDGGHVVGQSSDVNVKFAYGTSAIQNPIRQITDAIG